MINSKFDVKAQWAKCMTSWCPKIPLTGKQQISIIYSPLDGSSTTTKEMVIKVKNFAQSVWEEEGIENSFFSSSSRNYRYRLFSSIFY